MQSSYLQTDKSKKKRNDEEFSTRNLDKKKKKDFSAQRKAKRGENYA